MNRSSALRFFSFQIQQDCLADNKVVDIQYFHRAILPKPDCKPLTKTTIVISTYTTPERDYLINLAEALGADVNDRFIRGEKPILICPTPKGKKYEGAVKWSKRQHHLDGCH